MPLSVDNQAPVIAAAMRPLASPQEGFRVQCCLKMKKAGQKGFVNNALVDASSPRELEFIYHFADEAAARMIRSYT